MRHPAHYNYKDSKDSPTSSSSSDSLAEELNLCARLDVDEAETGITLLTATISLGLTVKTHDVRTTFHSANPQKTVSPDQGPF